MATRPSVNLRQIRYGYAPDWLRRKLLAALGSNHGYVDGGSMLEQLKRRVGADWLDHPGMIDATGYGVSVRHAFTSECWRIEPHYIDQLNRLAELIGIRWWIDGCSDWQPGGTVRIVIVPREGALS